MITDKIINWEYWEKISFKKCFIPFNTLFYFLQSLDENWHVQRLFPDFPLTDYSWWRVHKRANLTVKAH